MNGRKAFFAYGIFAEPVIMYRTCPGAVMLGPATLLNYRREERGAATIVRDISTETEGLLWSITPADEKILDQIEGFPLWYRKEKVTVVRGNIFDRMDAMVYVMND